MKHVQFSLSGFQVFTATNVKQLIEMNGNEMAMKCRRTVKLSLGYSGKRKPGNVFKNQKKR